MLYGLLLYIFYAEIQKERDENLKLKCQLGFRTKLVEDYISCNDNDMERSSLLNVMEGVSILILILVFDI